MADGERVVQRVVGVYDADGTIRGELTYFVGARLGRTHCSLCDITHGMIRERPGWQACRTSLPIEFETFHRNDQPEAVRDLLNETYPAVAAQTAEGWYRLLGPQDLEDCDSSPEALISALETAIADVGLSWA